ncbi:MAG: endopeptidase La [Clostridia bacterium]|nr:endopeptidase La [Clostridia bacterium]
MSLIYDKAEVLTYPTIALRGIVVFPGVTTSFELGRKLSIASLQNAMENDQPVYLSIQKNPAVDEPGHYDLTEVGVVANIKSVLRLTNGNLQIMAEGLYRARRISTVLENDHLESEILPYRRSSSHPERERRVIDSLWTLFSDYLRYINKPSSEILDELHHIDDAGVLADFLASNFLNNFEDRKFLLEEVDSVKRGEKLCGIFEKNIALMELENSIQSKVKYRLQRRQRDAYLREQLNTIRGELGMDEEGVDGEDGNEYAKRIAETPLPKEVAEKLKSEASKLAKMPFGSSEASVIHNYLDVCLELPWEKFSEDRLDIAAAQKILDEDHDGIVKVKERILEFLSVKQLKQDIKGQILCLVGPPGVGKTSVAKSIARAIGRNFARISLGGIRDEAEIRGHRKTYIGAMPGRIINAVKLAGTSNPVILLDELDKLTTDSHGDPAAALLEVLDSEQNHTFRDHFIELPYDLSSVMFIATANTLDTVPHALLDRLEVIEMGSYTDSEKLSIAKNHLIPKQMAAHGLKKTQCRFTDEGIMLLITGYTKENGVRNLERTVASVCRKTAKQIVSGQRKSVRVTPETVKQFLGPVKYLKEKMNDSDEIGVVNGLAWTSLGGELLRVEVSTVQGSGKLELTGNLGDVMKESAKAAVSYIRKHGNELGIDPEFYVKQDVHIHVPEGAVPKDGPSAGVTLCTALVSELTGKTVKRNVAMTGEITLTGRVLPIGGLREKTMAAYKYGCDTVIIPYDNSGDIEELDNEVKEHLKLIPVKNVSEVLRLAVNP